MNAAKIAGPASSQVQRYGSAWFFQRNFLGLTILVGAVLWAYWPARSGGFVLDDDLLLTHNSTITASDGLYRIWFTKEPADYWPISNSTLWLEWRMWGGHSTGYHVTNLLLHVADSLLIWLVLRRLSIPGAWLAALLFAVHPVNVESVAWIAQRKNVLALLFFLLSILWWLKGEVVRRTMDPGPGTRQKAAPRSKTTWGAGGWYGLSWLAFLLAMLSKGSVAILPLVLLLLVWWQRGTIDRWDLLRTAPFFLVAGVLTVVNLQFQAVGSGEVIRDVNFLQRLLGAGAVVWFYLGKALLPVHLVFVYPQWNIEPTDVRWWLPLLAAVVVTVFLIGKRNSPQAYWVRPVLWAWIFFGLALLPVMGFTDVGYMRHSLVADHYEHIALVGILGLVAAAAATGWQRISGLGRPALVVAAGAVVLTLTFLARQQSSLYANALTLYQNTLQNNPDSWLIQNNLGLEFYYAGQLDKAITHYQAALQLNPICALAYRNLGIAFADLNRLPEAIDCYQKALQIVPNYAEAHYNLGVALASVGRAIDAKEEYQLAVECKPDYPAAQHNLGLALAADGRFTEAISHFEQAIKEDPDFVEAYVNLASAYAAIGQFDKAVNYAQRALELAHSQNQTKLADGIAARLKFYQERLSGAPEKTTTLDAGAAKP